MRQTIREIEVNVAYRWFLGYDFYDKIPHFTTYDKITRTVKEYHGFRYTNEKGKVKTQIKALLTFVCLNMKKLANMMSKLGRKRPNFLIFREIYIKFKILINSKVIFN